MSGQNSQNGVKPQTLEGVTRITVGGFKSIAQEQSIEIRPLTILAGANSSGKSSIMQPLLLLKQTLEAPYDPGPLLLSGPNIKFTSAEQVFSRTKRGAEVSRFHIKIEPHGHDAITSYFEKRVGKSINLSEMVMSRADGMMAFRADMTSSELEALVPIAVKRIYTDAFQGRERYEYIIARERCFLEPRIRMPGFEAPLMPFGNSIGYEIRRLVHLPGLRGNPARTYPVSAVGNEFAGTFDFYVASVIARWQSEASDNLAILCKHLVELGLTSIVTAEFLNDTQVELRVGRTRKSDSQDTVSIADVGFGVSQTLPVLVALLAAEPGQLVYLEQPEIHLHPRAQTAMAQVLADAAMRGVRVVAETHSSLLLLGIQTLVAEGRLPPELVKLHWFERGDDGATTIRSADLDESGAFGDWPEDFDDVTLDAQGRYLDAAERRMAGV